MRLEKVRFATLFFFIIYFVPFSYAQQPLNNRDNRLLKDGINVLKKYFVEKGYWHASDPGMAKDVKGLINFIEDEPIDSILFSINALTSDPSIIFVSRLPEHVTDSLSVPGYFAHDKVKKKSEMVKSKLQREYQNKEINLPPDRLAEVNRKAKTIPQGEGMKLFADSVFIMPGNLIIPEVIPDSILENEDSFNRLVELDSIRDAYVEQKRIEYNDSVLGYYKESALNQYRKELFDAQYNRWKEQFTDSVRLNNYQVLKGYNDYVMQAVNDSIFNVIQVLARYADYIDTTKIEIQNLHNEPYKIGLSNYSSRYQHVWLKNEQNDSLRLLVKNLDKRTLQFTIDDGVTFSRFKPKQTKGFDFSSLNKNKSGLTQVGDQYAVYTPWTISGNGNIGFTQAYIENWKAGGSSYLSLLSVLKGEVDYKSRDENVEWENSLELNNGWIRQGSETKKNSDNIEFISKFGYSAFKKWYYSFAVDIKTQLFKGYNYSTDQMISNFKSPITSTFKVGMDYKPNKNLSLLLSPITSKTVFVKDTANIDQTTYGIAENKQRLWKPGLNIDLAFSTKFKDNITYKTNYDMFVNYRAPFSKFDVNWENTITAKLTDLITMTFRLYIKYDDDVTFDTGEVDGEGNSIYETRWQVKELVTFGFTYNIDKKIRRTHRIR